jgi:tetratricopeptide (TPR) repeat protein
LHALRARALAERKRLDEAIEEYQQAIEIAPDNLDWYFPLAQACVATGQPARAREVLATLLVRKPDHAEALELFQTLERP